MPKKFTVHTYFDFLSPYSYFLCRTILQHKARLPEVTWLWKPILLAKIFTHLETKAPAEIESKRRYLFKHCARMAIKNNISFKPPRVHPFNPLYVLRLACTSVYTDTSIQEKVIQLLWQKIWGEGLDADTPETILSWLQQGAIPEPEKLMEKIFSPTVKDELKMQTQEALDAGAFGVPTLLIHDHQGQQELFWGNDAWDDVLAYLEGRDVLDPKFYESIVTSNIKGATHKLNL